MGELVKFYSKDAAKDPDAVLEQALGQYTDVLILGWNKEGMFDPRATLGLKSKDMVWIIELFKLKLLRGDYDE